MTSPTNFVGINELRDKFFDRESNQYEEDPFQRELLDRLLSRRKIQLDEPALVSPFDEKQKHLSDIGIINQTTEVHLSDLINTDEQRQ